MLAPGGTRGLAGRDGLPTAGRVAVPAPDPEAAVAASRVPGSHQDGPCSLTSGGFGAAVVAAAAIRRRRRGTAAGSHRRLRLAAEGQALGTVVAERPEAPPVPELTPSWKAALQADRAVAGEQSSAWKELLRAEGDEAVGPVRFEKVGGPAGPEGGDALLYLPDLDFSGLLAAPQFLGLAAGGFELWRCFLPEGDRRTGFAELRSAVEAWAQRRAAAGARVTLLGEGFGGLLALAVALRLGRRLKGVALVRPATRLARGGAAPGPALGLAGALLRGPLAGAAGEEGASLPFLADAPLAALDPGSLLGRAASGALGARAAAAAARAGSLDFRLRAWLRDGWEAVECELRRPADSALLPPVLIACSGGKEGDAWAEAEALKAAIKERCGAGRLQLAELEDAGHEPLADARMDLAKVLRASPICQRPKDAVTDYTYPTLDAVEQGSEGVERLASVVSPVFCSWDAGAPSQRRFGLAGVPTPGELGGRPVLLVGNHQILGLDLGPLVREFLVDRGVVARGLANPDAMRRMSNEGRDSTFETFGAVPVTPRNIFKLLQKGEMALLFPGGMREALHGPGEEYKVLWPERTDFVRVAARFGAVVVPFGGVGAEESVKVLAKTRDISERLRSFLPFLPPERSEKEGKREGGLLEVAAQRPSFPVLAPALGLASESSPGLGDRYYFSFGEPVDLKGLDPKDKTGCAEAYAQIRLAVQRELTWLLEARQRDPFRGLLRRQLYERAAQLGSEGPRRVAAGPLQGGAVQSYGLRAPSFPIEELPPP